MAKRCNHYELAFEAFLRRQRLAYVAVNEQRRSLVAQGSLKSLDYLVTLPENVTLLVDIKGRQFPSGTKHKQYWRNWSTWDDLESMARWQNKFGLESVALLVFAYQVIGDRAPLESERLFEFRDQRYAFLAVRVADYIQFSRRLSAKWNTVAMPAIRFRECALPFDELCQPLAEAVSWPGAERSRNDSAKLVTEVTSPK